MLIIQIERYANNELTEAEALNLWVEMFKHPAYLQLLETLLMLRALFHKNIAIALNRFR